jgi:hypothetical protein
VEFWEGLPPPFGGESSSLRSSDCKFFGVFGGVLRGRFVAPLKMFVIPKWQSHEESPILERRMPPFLTYPLRLPSNFLKRRRILVTSFLGLAIFGIFLGSIEGVVQFRGGFESLPL